MKLIRYNNQPAFTLNPSNPVFFAKKPPKSGESGSIVTKSDIKRDMDKESLRYCEEIEKIEGNPNAKQIANLFRKGQLEGNILRDVREILKDPNKMKDDEYKWFVKALAAGKFPKKGKNALKFIKALNGTEEERKYAREVIKDLSEESAGNMSERAERNHLKKLSELREEAVKSTTLESVAGKSGTITASADIHSAVETAVGKKKKNWEVDKMPEDLVKELDKLEGRQVEIAEESNKLDKELKAELKKEEPDKTKVDHLEKKIKALDTEFEKIGDKLKDPQKKETAHLSQQLNRMRAVEKLGGEIGLSIGKTNKLKIWALGLTSVDTDSEESSKKIQGIIVNQVTGKAEKEKSTITITGIRFDHERTDYEDDAAGDLIVEYINEEGKTEEAGYTNFVKIMNGCEAYEDMESLDEVNAELAEELGYLPIKEGMELTAEAAVEVDEKGIRKENKKIHIREIDKKAGTITLEEPAVKISRRNLGSSVDNAMYFDRMERIFEFGEFVRFVKQNRYKRTLKAGEMDKVLASASERTNRECAEIEKETASALGNKRKRTSKVETAAFIPPKEGEGGKVIYLMDNGQLRKGRLTKEPGSEDYTFEPIRLQGVDRKGPDIGELVAEGLPMHMAIAQQAKTVPKEWRKRRINGRSLMELQNAGGIANAEMGDAGGQDISAIEGLKDYSGGPSVHGRHEARDEHGKEEHDEHGEEDHEGQDEHKKAKYNEEALPYNVVHKVGGFKAKEVSFLKTYWDNTRFFSCDDIWQMGKAMWEYYERRFERRQKERYSKVGEEIPFWAPEMRRVNQASENEQVNQFKESYEHKGIFEIEERLWTTHNKDEMKAAFTVLAEKGHIRWDNIQLWQNLNKFIRPEYAIPIPANGDPYTRLGEKDKDDRTGMDFLKPAIDSLWGEGQYNEWYASCKSHSQSQAKSYYEEGKELEGVDGGHALRLGTLLHQHKMGIFVDPHEYEGLLLHSIEAGKSTMQPKIYYMIEGVTAQNPHGHTIMPFERIAHINSEMLARFPILEYLCADVPRPPDGKLYRFTLDDYRAWAKQFDMGNPMNCKPTPKVDEFMWKYVIPSDETQNRINKALRNGENLDHDDMFAYLPPATEEVITDACTATTGRKKFLTLEGYANVVPGFSQYMRSLAETDNRNKLREAVKSYVRFEAIMTNRFEKEKDIYQRMGYSTLNSPTIVSTTPPQAFMNQMNAAMKKIIEAYNNPQLNQIASLMYLTTPNFRVDKDEQALQKKIDWALEHFGEVFDRVVKSDNGEKMRRIIEEENFTGMPFLPSDAEIAKRKAQYTDKLALD